MGLSLLFFLYLDARPFLSAHARHFLTQLLVSFSCSSEGLITFVLCELKLVHLRIQSSHVALVSFALVFKLRVDVIVPAKKESVFAL